MEPAYVIVLVVLAAGLIAAAVLVRERVAGRIVDGAGRRRCFVVWFLGVCGEGGVIALLAAHGFTPAPEWVAYAVALPLVPATILAFRDYAAIAPVPFVGACLVVAALGAAAAALVTLLAPWIGAWAWAAPALIALAALFLWFRRTSGGRDAFFAILALAVVAALVWTATSLLEYAGFSL